MQNPQMAFKWVGKSLWHPGRRHVIVLSGWADVALVDGLNPVTDVRGYLFTDRPLLAADLTLVESRAEEFVR